MKKYLVPLVLVLLVILIAVASNDKKEPAQGEVIKLGFVGPLTGDVANPGILARSAAEIAVEEINQMGGVNGTKITFIAEDGKCTPKDATTAGKKLIEVDKVLAIVGGMCSGETLAIAPLAESEKVVTVSYASSNPTITNAGDFIFRVFPSDSFQGSVSARYAYENLGKKAAVVYTNNE